MPGFLALIGFGLVAALAAVQSAVATEVELVRDGKRHELSEAARARIAERLPQLFSTCSLNSRDHPRVLVAEESVWQQTEAKDHLTVRFDAPIQVRQAHGRTTTARELMLGLAHAEFPGPELSRDEKDVVAHAKCSGGDMIRFVCAPELRPLMAGLYDRLCAWLDEHGQRAFRSDRPKP